MGLSALAAVGSQSRGALLGHRLDGDILLAQEPEQVVYGVAGRHRCRRLVLTVMPQQWYDRMATIQDLRAGPVGNGAHQCMAHGVQPGERQAVGRRLRRVPVRHVRASMRPIPDNVHDSHSIYFEVLGEHGFVGLGLFLRLA